MSAMVVGDTRLMEILFPYFEVSEGNSMPLLCYQLAMACGSTFLFERAMAKNDIQRYDFMRHGIVQLVSLIHPKMYTFILDFVCEEAFLKRLITKYNKDARSVVERVLTYYKVLEEIFTIDSYVVRKLLEHEGVAGDFATFLFQLVYTDIQNSDVVQLVLLLFLKDQREQARSSAEGQFHLLSMAVFYVYLCNRTIFDQRRFQLHQLFPAIYMEFKNTSFRARGGLFWQRRMQLMEEIPANFTAVNRKLKEVQNRVANPQFLLNLLAPPPQ